MEASPGGVALVALLTKPGNAREKFHGTMSELMILLAQHRSEDRKDWPHSPKGMGDALRRLAPALRVLGYDCVDEEKRGGVRRWRISLIPEVLSAGLGSPASPVDSSGQPPASAAEVGEVSVGHPGHAGRGLESSTPQKEKQYAADDNAEEF